jgi:uncharacterized protein YktA (UPF0223 family)
LGYSYPISTDWSKDEIVDVVQFFSYVERAYEKGIERNVLLSAYNKFKSIVPSKSEEKKLCAEFEEESGYSAYLTLKKAKEIDYDRIIKM